MEFTSAFYLKSLSDKNQQDQIGKEVDSLFESHCESVENILNFALEMLAPDNACSDILRRIPRHVVREVIRSLQSFTIMENYLLKYFYTLRTEIFL